MWASWLHRLQGGSEGNRNGRVRRPKLRQGPAAPRRPSVPRLEALEDRTVPSTFTVRNLLDSGAGSLRQAVLDANANPGADLIRFAPAARDGAIALTSGQLDVTDDLTIDGPGRNRLTVSGNDASRVFHISGSTTDVVITRLTIADGRASVATATGPFGPVTLGGGILNDGGHLTLSHVTVTNNQVVGFNGAGGAIANVFGATLTVAYSMFTGNRAIGSSSGVGGAVGGAILSDAGSLLSVAHSRFAGNQATGTDASAGGGGAGRAGAIANRGGSLATLTHSTFADNVARGGNGANGGPGQNGGTGGPGRAGAINNRNDSLLGPAAGATLIVAHCAFTGNQV